MGVAQTGTPRTGRVVQTPSFNDFELTPAILKGISELGFKEPTPVQAKVIPMLLKGERDLVALAQTGTGKTAAFGLPMLQMTDANNRATQGLILCPTRELCMQISKDLESFSRFAPHLRILAVYGGSSIQTQMRALHRGIHILVATPGRMNDLLRRGAAKLDGIKRVVLDEADEMLNMGFQEELESILKEVPKTARTLLFSATMPKQVAAMAGKYMKDPEEVIVGQRNSGAERVTHECFMVHARDRYPALKRIIDARPGFYGIVFCRTRVETQDIASRLTADGYNADALHGDLSQDQRDRTMNNFRVRNLQILVATDVASRGLDVNDLTHIINYDLPSDPDVYTHRSGRTGRAGKAGVSIVLVHMRENYKIRAIERIMNKRFENKQVPSGREVCEAQLVALLEKIKNAEVPDAQLDAYLPKINEVLGDLTREDLIKRMVGRDFSRILSYYKDAHELNVPPHSAPRERGPQREHRDQRDEPRPERSAPPRGDDSGELVTVRINIGRRNAINPPTLISLINRSTPGPMLKLGRISITENDTLFEVQASGVEKLLANLNKVQHGERQVSAVIDNQSGHINPDRRPRPQHGDRPPYRGGPKFGKPPHRRRD